VKIPKLWRKKRGGKYYGSWLATIDGTDLPLNTRDAELARKRLAEALRGKREWPSDAELAAAALEADFDVAPAGQQPPYGAPSGQPPATAATAGAPAAAAPAAAPVVPDAIEPPRALPPISSSADDARADAEATNAAAAETGGAGDAGAPGSEFFTPDALKGMLTIAADALVEAQIQLQAYVIERKTGKRPQPLPEQLAGPLRTAAGQAWVAQFERWFPDMGDVPPWIIAVAAPALLIPIQVATAKPVEKPAEETPAQAAA
jgi:hypothetical protein